jgi:hypothetical protein
MFTVFPSRKVDKDEPLRQPHPSKWNQSCVQLSSFCEILLTWSDVAIIVKDGVVDCRFGF